MRFDARGFTALLVMRAPRFWSAWVALVGLCSKGCDAGRVCRLSSIDRNSDGWKVPRGCTALDMSFATLGPQGAEHLARVLEKRPVRGLNLTWSAIGIDGIPALVRGIERCPSLGTLDLTGNWLADAGVLAVTTALGRFGNVRHLHLRWNGISGESVALIAGSLVRLQRLETLDLGGNWLLDDGVAAISRALRQHTVLRDLRLDYNGAGPAAMPHVAAVLRHSFLTRLDLRGNHIDDLGVKHLVEGLHNNTSLEQLSLRLNEYIGDTGAGTLGNVLLSHSRLARLDLGGNRLSDTGAVRLLDALEHGKLRELQLDDNSPRRSSGHAMAPMLGEALLDRLKRLQAGRAASITLNPVQESRVVQAKDASTSEVDRYWAQVYPAALGSESLSPTRAVSFFYAIAPQSLMQQGCEQHAWSKCRLDAYFEHGQSPPRIEPQSSFSPFRLPPGACMRNLFEWDSPSIAAWESSYAYAAGIPDNGWVEVAHTREQTGGAWLYLASGSGVFWNCGRSLRARNKVAAAVQLLQQRRKLTRSEALRMLARGIEQGDSGMCGGNHCAAFMAIFSSNRTDRNDNCYGRCRADVPLSTWLERSAFGNGARDWWYDHMSASSVFDHGLYRWAKQLKYESVQLTMQPQVWCGIGWTTELLDLRVRPHRILDVLPHLAVRDPQAIDARGEPCMVRTDNISRKAFQICIYCEGTIMERNARCIADASRGRPKFTIYSQYPRHRFNACMQATR